MKEYSFKKREVIVRIPKKDFSLGAENKEITAKVEYVGAKTENYKAGDTIIFNQTVGANLKFLGEDYWKIENEDYIICQIVTNESL